MVNRARDGEDENGSPEIAGFFSTAILARRKFVAKKVTKGLLGMNIDGKRAQFNFDDNMRPFPRIIVSVDVYADESGTHDEAGKRPGAEVATISGYAGWKNKLKIFSRQWKDHLKLNGVDCFHFQELNDSKYHPEEHPCYQGWSNRRKDAFALALAKIAANNMICPVGGNIPTGWIYEENVTKGKPHEYPYKHCFDQFFFSVLDELSRVLPKYRGNIAFFFDRKDGDAKWQCALLESWNEFAKRDARLQVAPVFQNKELLIPLQAADLIAWPTRRLASKAWQEGKRAGIRQPKRQNMDKLIQVLYQKMPNSAPGMKWIKKA
jgi:hypothetical protein